MPIGKKIYDVMASNFSKKRKRKADVAKKQKRGKPPAHVDNFKNNSPTMANSRNTGVIQEKRVISPNEGMPAVNAKSGEKLVEKAVTKVKDKNPQLLVSGAIEGVVKKVSKGKDKSSE